MSSRPDEPNTGLHHVTSIADAASRNMEFYTRVLGLRMVKRTVNFDDHSTYHLYYGDDRGRPGTALTFFPFGRGGSGRPGRGQVIATAFTVDAGALDFWRERFDEYGVPTEPVKDRFGREVLPFRDHDGHPMELVVGETDIEPRTAGPVPEAYALRGFHGVTIDSHDPGATRRVLSELGFEQTGQLGDRTRLEGRADRARIVDILDRPEGPRGRPGAGTVHHIAFRTRNEETQLQWRERLSEMGLRVTEQKDRFYFKSIYFREPGGVLFEIATEAPGFTRDEDPDDLGGSLKLPPWLEGQRDEIESKLPDLEAPDPE